MTALRTAALASLLLLARASPSFAQNVGHDHHPASSATSGWNFSFNAQAFLNGNLQQRKFRDFHVVESQNWLVTSASRAIGKARLTLHGMVSAEPWTLRAIGSPQVFQTGETFERLPLIDYQHPHDLVMGATARLDWVAGDWGIHVEGGPAGAPAVGPPAFMHRASAGPNPTAPLGHHQLDATHISHSVLTVGVSRDYVTVDASAFHGREPNEDRVSVEQGPIDSYAVRVSWAANSRWNGQVSWAEIAFPDQTEFTDHRLVTASVSYGGAWRGRPLAVTGAFGVVHETASGITLPAVLIEGAWQARGRDTMYMRGELLRKNILSAGGYHPPGFFHEHTISTIGALTVGYERTIADVDLHHRFGLGGDVTAYVHDRRLDDNYGRPLSVHVFLRYRYLRRQIVDTGR